MTLFGVIIVVIAFMGLLRLSFSFGKAVGFMKGIHHALTWVHTNLGEVVSDIIENKGRIGEAILKAKGVKNGKSKKH